MEGDPLSDVGSRTLAQIGHATDGRLVVASWSVNGHRQRAVPAPGQRHDVVQKRNVPVRRVRDRLVAPVRALCRNVVVQDPVRAALRVTEMPFAVLAVDPEISRPRSFRRLRHRTGLHRISSATSAGRGTGLRFHFGGELRRQRREHSICGRVSGRLRLRVVVVVVVDDLDAGRQIDIV